VIRQGDIILLDLDPTKGHEQAGKRSALVISNAFYNAKTAFVIVLPITNTRRAFPMHVELDDRTRTTGVVLCEQPRNLDIQARTFRVLEQAPPDVLERCVELVMASIRV